METVGKVRGFSVSGKVAEEITARAGAVGAHVQAEVKARGDRLPPTQQRRHDLWQHWRLLPSGVRAVCPIPVSRALEF